jgi:hypothetical protein
MNFNFCFVHILLDEKKTDLPIDFSSKAYDLCQMFVNSKKNKTLGKKSSIAYRLAQGLRNLRKIQRLT